MSLRIRAASFPDVPTGAKRQNMDRPLQRAEKQREIRGGPQAAIVLNRLRDVSGA
ncbi:MAG: hypothetical protein ACTSPE_13505 [Candidatus Thorarchaeota archaeon]